MLKLTWKSALINLGLLGIGISLLWLAFRGQDFKEIANGLKHIKYGYVIISVFFLIISHYIRGLRWIQLIETLGFKPTPLEAFQAVMIGYLANLALPRIGEITRCGIINRAVKIPLDKIIGTVITERVWDVFSLGVIALLALSLQYKILSNFLSKHFFILLQNRMPPIFMVLVILVTIILTMAVLVWWWKKNFQKINKNAIYIWFKKFALGLVEGLKSFQNIQHKGRFLIYSALIWLGYAAASWLLFYSLDSTKNLGPEVAFVVLTAGSMGMIAPVQGGIGAYHWMVSHALVLYKIPLVSGLVYATVDHSSGVSLILILGTICLFSFFWGRSSKEIL